MKIPNENKKKLRKYLACSARLVSSSAKLCLLFVSVMNIITNIPVRSSQEQKNGLHFGVLIYSEEKKGSTLGLTMGTSFCHVILGVSVTQTGALLQKNNHIQK